MLKESEFDRTLKLVYKNRVVAFEKAIHDSESSLFWRINQKADSLKLGFTFPTYRVVTDSDQPGFGCCEFIEGEAVCSEQKEGGYPEFLQNDLEIGPFLDEWAVATNETQKKELGRQTFFFTRTDEQLIQDFFFFTALAEIGLTDTHGANFIIREGDGALCLIDGECFDDDRIVDAADLLVLVEAAYIAHSKPIPDSSQFKKEIQSLVSEFAKKKEHYPNRCVPMDTQKFYSYRNNFAALGESSLGIDAIDLLKILDKDYGYDVGYDPNSFEETQLEKVLKDTFQQFDIPYFTTFEGNLFLDGQKIGTKKETLG